MLRESHRLGIEPATCKSQVQRPTSTSWCTLHTFKRHVLRGGSAVGVGPANNILQYILCPLQYDDLKICGWLFLQTTWESLPTRNKTASTRL